MHSFNLKQANTWKLVMKFAKRTHTLKYIHKFTYKQIMHMNWKALAHKYMQMQTQTLDDTFAYSFCVITEAFSFSKPNFNCLQHSFNTNTSTRDKCCLTMHSNIRNSCVFNSTVKIWLRQRHLLFKHEWHHGQINII